MDGYKSQLDSLETQNSSLYESSSYSNTSITPPHFRKSSSILKKRAIEQAKQNAMRTDSYGLPIEKNGKHKICFKTPLFTHHEVENWKEYNVDVNEEGVCTCRLF